MTNKAKTASRIERRFQELRKLNRAGLITFVTAGDPDYDRSLEIVKGLPQAGADFIELGMPFTDPMADGPSIQASSLRALKKGMTLKRVLELVTTFRKTEDATPIILMGYYNPIYSYGVDRFLKDASAAGVDGLIIVDLPPEEDEELCLPALHAGLNFIRLVTPTTSNKRLPTVLGNSSGFLYYVSITGITGTRGASMVDVQSAITRLRQNTGLPIAIGFGIRSPEQAAEIASMADAAVVGSALVDCIASHAEKNDRSIAVKEVLALVEELAKGVRGAKRKIVEKVP